MTIDHTTSLASMKELWGLWEMLQSQVIALRLLSKLALECLMSLYGSFPLFSEAMHSTGKGRRSRYRVSPQGNLEAIT